MNYLNFKPMTPIEIKSLLVNKFIYSPTNSQIKAIELFVDFLISKNIDEIFILKGYAGTGKSSLIGYLVSNISKLSYKTVLLAPTGRAAKVFSNYSNKKAKTIHKQIYFSKTEASGKIKFNLKLNKYKKALFIIDESSMISGDSKDSNLFQNNSLLDDLIKYVYSGENCKLIFVGDPAQLPPINLKKNPALDKNYLFEKFDKKIIEFELKDVVRQEKNSSTLINATKIRDTIFSKNFIQFKFSKIDNTKFIRLKDSNDIFDSIDNLFNSSSKSDSVVIVRSNKRANQYNSQIRSKILFLESELNVGEEFMVVKNNYYWLTDESIPGFIANGDLIRVVKIISYHEIYNFNFIKVIVELVDYPDENSFETILLINTLNSESPSLTSEESKKLYNEVQKDYFNINSKYKRFILTKKNQFFNALQIKYSYAITCHKSQGGQWENVFVEYPYLPDGPNKDFFRWLYTAITRAKKRVFLIGFPESYFL